MKRAAWIAVVTSLVLGFIAGAVSVDIGDQEDPPGRASAEACSPIPVKLYPVLDASLVPWSGLSFESAYWARELPLPSNLLTLIRAEVDGPGFEGSGDVSIWAAAGGHGTFPGARLYALNPVARRVDGRSTYPATRLRQFIDDGEPVFDPRVIRAIAPILTASCVESSPT